MIDIRRTCVHCGVAMVAAERSHWCAQCQQSSRENRGVCNFCSKDIAAWSNCWQVRRLMDQVTVKQQIPFMGGCPSCKEHNGEDVEMEVVELTISPRMKYLRMVCPVCFTRCETRYNLYNPPPGAGMRRGEVG